MNRLKKLLCGIALIGLATGCSHEDIPNTGSVEKQDQGSVYARLTLSLPSTRSVTIGDDGNSDVGFEVGQPYENSVTSVLIVLTSKDGENYNYVASALTDTKGQTPANGESDENNPEKPMYTVSFESEEIAEYATKEVYVFAFCNPSMTLVENVNALRPVKDNEGNVVTPAKAVNTLKGHISEGNNEISEKNYFLMSNHSLTSITLPTSQDLLSIYNTPKNPFFLGTVDVSRVTARFDFRQTTVEIEGEENTTPNRYPIYDNYTINNPKYDEDGNQMVDDQGNPVFDQETRKTLMGYVVLDGMSLMNEAINYYCLPRVSRDGMESGTVLCGGETSSNFVVSPDPENKTAVPLSALFMNNNYLYNGLTPNATSAEPYNYSRFSYDALSLTDHDEDNDENWTVPNNETKTGYKIWKYVTENTIPGKDADGNNNTIKYQRLGVTTCIVFRGYIEPIENSGLKEMMDGQKSLYCYNGQLIGDLDALKNKVAEMPVSSLADAFYAAAKANGYTMNDDGTIDPNEVNVDFPKTAVTERGEGLKIFRPEGGKYYCYYIYRNRHNDNGRTDMMGPMEFAVVRNNVYKIDVLTINDFGHTKNPDDDPDPEDPDTPDEPNKAYFRLQVRVLPWVVRVNHAIL